MWAKLTPQGSEWGTNTQTFVSVKLWGLLELLQQTCLSEMSEVSQIHPAACLYPLVFSVVANTHNPDTWKKERKYWFLCGLQSVPLSQSKTARWSASTHWTERRENTQLARCAAFVRPALNNDVKLQCWDSSLSSHSHSLLRKSSPVHSFRIRPTVFVVMQEFYALNVCSVQCM